MNLFHYIKKKEKNIAIDFKLTYYFIFLLNIFNKCIISENMFN